MYTAKSTHRSCYLETGHNFGLLHLSPYLLLRAMFFRHLSVIKSLVSGAHVFPRIPAAQRVSFCRMALPLGLAFGSTALFIQPLHLESPRRPSVEERLKPRESLVIPSKSNKDADESVSTTMEDIAEEAEEESAFDERTGEINWDCPCLGGMADGPCGEQFKQAFSCFVFSEAEPKGIDCVDKFKLMQDCFREHPEVYADEIAADEAAEAEAVAESKKSEDASTDAESLSDSKA